MCLDNTKGEACLGTYGRVVTPPGDGVGGDGDGDGVGGGGEVGGPEEGVDSGVGDTGDALGTGGGGC